MIECSKCSGLGLPQGCTDCGTILFGDPKVLDEDLAKVDYPIPAYYRRNQWQEDKVKRSANPGTNVVIDVLNSMVKKVSSGEKLNASYAIMLPYGMGKKTAMFSIIQQYLKHGFSVAPVMDIASLAILENNFRLNEKESIEIWRKMINCDLLCVHGVDFSAKHMTMKLFLNIAGIRGLQGKSSLLFDQNSLKDLRSYYIADNLDESNNTKDIDHLSNPFILDGVIGRVTS